MATQINTTVLPAGPVKRIWVNKHHLPQFGGGSPTSPVWEVECEGKRYSGFHVCFTGDTCACYDPDYSPGGPHAWIEAWCEIVISTAAEEAA